MPPPPESTSAALALALLRMEGVGRVTAGRILARFPTPEALRATPREQVLHRLKGAANAEALVGRLFGEELEGLLSQAVAFLEALAGRQIAVLTPHHAHWPPGFDALDRADRPAVLYAYGETSVLAAPQVALLARPPLEGPAFETAQDLVKRLLEAGVAPASGLQHGFDAVVQKLATGGGHAGVMVASAGLQHVPPPLRPVAAAAVQAGGVLISPFPPDHGPFAHDDVERARLLAAMARAVAAFGVPEGSPEARALGWALEHDRPAFGVGTAQAPLPERAHPLLRPMDLDWVLAAARAGDAG